MKCFNCGAQMAPGQKICSICDSDNSKQIYEKSSSYNYEKVDYDYKKDDDYKPEEKQVIKDTSESKNKWVSIFVIILIFILIITIIKFALDYYNDKRISEEKSKSNDIFTNYL